MPRDDEQRPAGELSRPDPQSPDLPDAGSLHPATSREPWLVVLAGLLTAGAVALGLRPSMRLSSERVLAHGALWVLATAMAGTCAMGTARFFLRPEGPRAFLVDALEAGAAWLLLPPLWLLAARESPWTLAFAAGVAGVLAVCLRGMMPAEPIEVEPTRAGPLFAELPAPDSGRGQAFAVAVCLECATVLALRRQVLPASLLAALGSFVFVWKRLTALMRARRQTMTQPALRSAVAAVLALLVVVPLLLVGLARLGPVSAEGDAVAQAAARQRNAGDRDSARDAYRGIILLTVPKKDLELTTPLARNPLQSGRRKPLLIPFDGAYWYFQAPHQDPGLRPHVARGDPVKVSIHSKGWIPLAMQAHQTLARPVDLRGCEAMQVTLRNGDNRPGQIEMGVLLTDSTSPGKPSLFLGTHPILSTQPSHFAFKAEPVEEDLTFAIPNHAALRQFDQITVFFFPATERMTLGARVGINQFAMEPR